jgi:glycosyltransferase involved in cell wall biosynthesis
MALGKPVVSVDSTAIPELIEAGVNGLLVPPLDADRMSAAMEKLINDEELRREMGRRNLVKAKRYDFDVIADDHERLFEGVLSAQ